MYLIKKIESENFDPTRMSKKKKKDDAQPAILQFWMEALNVNISFLASFEKEVSVHLVRAQLTKKAFQANVLSLSTYFVMWHH